MSTDSKYPPSVKAGKPELGNTPSGWRKDTLNHYLKLKQRKVKIEDETEYDLVTVKRSRGGVVRREHLLGKQISVKSQFALKTGDFLISKRQIVHGACGIVPEDLDGSIVSNEYSIFTAKDNFDLTYLSYLSETLYFQQTCFHSSIGVHIEKMIFKLDNWFKWEFNIPPLPEQQKIAQILSTWDKAIATTEKLITTSQQQKKALMQQLLTGKKRLVNPETGKVFEGDWEEILLEDIASKIMVGIASAATHAYSPSGIRMLRNLNIKDGWIDDSDMLFISEKYEIKHKNKRLKAGDILTVRTGYPGLSAVVPKKYDNAQCFTSLITRLNQKKALPDFICKYINSEFGKKFISSGEAGGAQKNVNAGMLKRMPISLPQVDEQQKIALVLTAADKEIEILEAKLTHLKDEKKALMQQLLTGKRRVKVEHMEEATC